MKARVEKNTVILIALYIFLFAWAVVHTIYRDHIDLTAKSQRNHLLFEGEQSKYAACGASLNKDSSTITDKQGLIDTLQNAFVASQGPQQQQAASIASCITNLAKMNPTIREKITVIPIFIGTADIQGRFPIKRNDRLNTVLSKGYINELLIITNEPERNFHGILKCAQAFDFIDTPAVGTDAAAMIVSEIPQRLSTIFPMKFGTMRPILNGTHRIQQ